MTAPARPDLDRIKSHGAAWLSESDLEALVAWVEVCERTLRDVVDFAACTPCGPFCSRLAQRHVDYCSWHLVQRFTPLLPPPAPR